jgi:hypothetical protein
MEDLKVFGMIAGLVLSAVGLLLNALSNRQLARQIRNSSNIAVYEVALRWGEFLLKNPEYNEMLEDPSSGKLTDKESTLAEYRLDIVEFVYRQKKLGVYRPEPGSIRSSIDQPLVKGN